jgi:hypothetical protein
VKELNEENPKSTREYLSYLLDDSFKSSLDDLLEAKKIKSYKNFSTDNAPHFEIKENSAELELTIESLKN